MDAVNGDKEERMKVLIADDEPLAVERLSRLVTQMGHEVIATAHHGQDVLNHIENDSPDVVLLDIQMPGMTGIEMLSKLEKRPITVITTANHDKALDAYNLDVVDYLVKPFSFDRFQRSVERAKAQLSYKNIDQKDILEKPNYITVKSDYKVVKILLDEIRNEYNHNVSQQVYMSEQVWGMVKNSKEDLTVMINEAASQMKDDSKSIDLSKKIFELVMEKKVDPIGHALSELKREIQQIF